MACDITRKHQTTWESERLEELTHTSEIEMTSAMVMATMTPVFNAEFVVEPLPTGKPLLGSAELHQVKRPNQLAQPAKCYAPR